MANKMETHKVAELVFDFDIYPRSDVDSQHVSYIVAAIEAGQEMPPIVICSKTRRIVDGFHRCKAYLRHYGPEHPVECVAKRYVNEAALFADCVRYNAAHGRRLSTHDRAHCLIVADRIGLEVEELASALHMTIEAVGEIRADRVGTLRVAKGNGQPVALKRTIEHMAGRSLTVEQAKANERLSGMRQSFYVNQVVTLIESKLLNTDDAELMERLAHLGTLIQGLAIAAKA